MHADKEMTTTIFDESTYHIHCLSCKCESTADCWNEGCLCLDCMPGGCGTAEESGK